MVKRKALMESLSSNLHSFLEKTSQNLSMPDKKFLRDSLIGLLRAGQPIVCQMARHLPDQQTKFISRLDRLDQHLIRNSGFDNNVKEALPGVWLPYFKDDTAIILDLSDMAKPKAVKMDYLATVRDGSTGELVNGYWLLEMYASMSRRNPVPILLEPFSHEEPCSPGQNPVVIKAVHKIFELTCGRGVLVIDRGFDGGIMFEDWLDNRYRFVARLVGKRHLLRFSGDSEQSNSGQWVAIQARQLAEQIPTPHYFSKAIKRHGKVTFRLSQVGWVKVRLPGREEDLTLVVSRIAGKDMPLMLLTNLPVENVEDAKRVLRYYIRRWECEEAIRFLKSQVNLEMIRAFRWTAIRRLVLLAVLVMIYLGWIVEGYPDIGDRLVYLSQPLPDKPDFLGYRLLMGLTEAINTCFWLHKDLLRRSLW
ncbi:MAG: transposase [Planctomycetota bacterium]|nr:transposase [Planctomycetota bacterium]